MRKFSRFFWIGLSLISFFSGECLSANNGRIQKVISFTDDDVQKSLKAFFLPEDHPMKPVLDEIFAVGHPLKNPETFVLAGFKILLTKHAGHTKSAYWRLAEHPKIHGYLFKVYLDSETKLKKNEGWSKLADRCKGAENIRKLIKEKNLFHFVVPDKWLYRVPTDPLSKKKQQEVILMVTNMNIVSLAESREAWKKVSHEELDELFIILSHGFGSSYLPGNICYTREGKFACLDTEIPQRSYNMRKFKNYLSEEMQDYWDRLIENAL